MRPAVFDTHTYDREALVAANVRHAHDLTFFEPRLTRQGAFRKDRRLNIRLSSKDLEAIQKRALAEGLPYQTLISSLLHKYASGRLKEVWRERPVALEPRRAYILSAKMPL